MAAAYRDAQRAAEERRSAQHRGVRSIGWLGVASPLTGRSEIFVPGTRSVFWSKVSFETFHVHSIKLIEIGPFFCRPCGTAIIVTVRLHSIL